MTGRFSHGVPSLRSGMGLWKSTADTSESRGSIDRDVEDTMIPEGMWGRRPMAGLI